MLFEVTCGESLLRLGTDDVYLEISDLRTYNRRRRDVLASDYWLNVDINLLG